MQIADEKILEVENLKTYFETNNGIVKAVNGVSFDVKKGEVLGIVGESGCGKSATAFSITQLLPGAGKIFEGVINYKYNDQIIDLAKLDVYGKKLRSIRGSEISVIFQEPMTAFNPVYTIGNQIAEVMLLHQKITKAEAKQKTIELLRKVGISAPAQRFDEYTHQLSGGMRQRAMIALALAGNPKLLIADEPTTALDVTIEAKILKLLKDIQEDLEMSIIMITHDLGVVGQMADRVLVMYMGQVVEFSEVENIFYNPKHPYTKGLLNSIPLISPQKKKLNPIEGSVPDPREAPKGCLFSSRCPEVMDICKKTPPDIEVDGGHVVKCWLYEERYNE